MHNDETIPAGGTLRLEHADGRTVELAFDRGETRWMCFDARGVETDAGVEPGDTLAAKRAGFEAEGFLAVSGEDWQEEVPADDDDADDEDADDDDADDEDADDEGDDDADDEGDEGDDDADDEGDEDDEDADDDDDDADDDDADEDAPGAP